MEPASNEEWRLWGEVDPMFGVAAWPGRAHHDTNPWTIEEFQALGRQDWRDFWTLWRSYHPVETDSVMEIGCGAGRISNALADTFDVVHALDVSPGMLAFARGNCDKPNVRWRLFDGVSPPLGDGSVAAVFSCHVLQHMSSEALVWRHFKESFRVLRPGGSLCIHVQMHSFPKINRAYSECARYGYRVFLALSALKASLKRRTMRRTKALPYMHGISVDRDDIFERLYRIGFRGVTVSTIRLSANGDPHTCVLARRP